MKRLVPVIAMAVVLFGGCANLEAQKRMDAFDERLNAYRILMRWGRYEDALHYILFRPGQGKPKPVDLEPLKQIRLASYQLVEKIIAVNETAADVTVVMTYYHEESNVLHTLRQVQQWWFNEERKQWYIANDFPDFIGNLNKNR